MEQLSPAPQTPNQNPKSNFNHKLINLIIGILLTLSKIADYYNLDDLAQAAEEVKWLLEMITLFL